MNLTEFFDQLIFSSDTFSITLGNIIAFFLGNGVLFALWWTLRKRVFPPYLSREQLDDKSLRKFWRVFHICAFLLLLLITTLSLGINYTLYEQEPTLFRISSLFLALFVWQFARLADLIISKILIRNYYQRRDESKKSEGSARKDAIQSANRTVQYMVYVLAILLIINSFDLNYELFTFNYKQTEFTLRISNILTAILVLLSAQLITWMLVHLVLFRYYQRKEINIGSQAAINQLLQYVIFVIALFIALDRLGINLTLVWAGAGALLIGVGIGLQQTVSDFFAGLMLLFERSVEVGDMLEMENLIGTVKKIGLRSSQIQTRDNITVIVPNSKLTSEKVINWSHFDDRARFYISVGVAYGSDTNLVKNLLISVANEHKNIMKYPPPIVRFVNFGDSSLDFELHFWSREFMRIEDVKSDLRFEIDRIFRENNVNIPFPQRDVWMRKEKED